MCFIAVVNLYLPLGFDIDSLFSCFSLTVTINSFPQKTMSPVTAGSKDPGYRSLLLLFLEELPIFFLQITLLLLHLRVYYNEFVI